jgi:predicted aldo/keto reductase-like oxidoreductase
LHGEEFVRILCCEAVLNKLQCPQGMTAFYGNFDRDAQEAESLKTIATALELGINLLDTAWIYQVYCIATAATSKLLIIYILRHDCTVPEP